MPPRKKKPAPDAPPLDWPESLLANASILSKEELALSKLLLQCGQAHLFAKWEVCLLYTS